MSTFGPLDFGENEVGAETPLGLSASATGLVLDQTFVADFDPQSVKKDYSIDGMERPVLPFPYLIQHRIRHAADEVGRDVCPIEFAR